MELNKFETRESGFCIVSFLVSGYIIIYSINMNTFIKISKSSAAAVILSVCGFLMGAGQAFAQVPGKYFAADLDASDLAGIVSAHPVLFWGGLVIVVALCLGYGINALIKSKSK